eukprot:UN30066
MRRQSSMSMSSGFIKQIAGLYRVNDAPKPKRVQSQVAILRPAKETPGEQTNPSESVKLLKSASWNTAPSIKPSKMKETNSEGGPPDSALFASASKTTPYKLQIKKEQNVIDLFSNESDENDDDSSTQVVKGNMSDMKTSPANSPAVTSATGSSPRRDREELSKDSFAHDL